MNKNYIEKQETLESILLSEDILTSIQKNLSKLLDIIPELSGIIVNPVKRDKDNAWNKLLLSLNVSQNDLTTRLAILLYNIGTHIGADNFIEKDFTMFVSRNVLGRLNYEKEITEEILYLVDKYDDSITPKDVEDNLELSEKLFFIQKYCCLPYESKEYKMSKSYFEKTENLLKERERQLGKTYKIYLNRKEIKK